MKKILAILIALGLILGSGSGFTAFSSGEEWDIPTDGLPLINR